MSVNQVVKNSVSLKLLLIFILILLFLIPLGMIEDLVRERSRRQDQATREVGMKWSGEQALLGPVLTVPYYTAKEIIEENKTKKVVKEKKYLYILPNRLDISGDVKAKKRYRGIYEVMVYESKFDIEGEMAIPSEIKGVKNQDDIRWEEAFWAFQVSDPRGIKSKVSILSLGKETLFEPGIPGVKRDRDEKKTELYHHRPKYGDYSLENFREMEEAFYRSLENGISSSFQAIPGRSFDFSLKMNLNGSQSLTFLPIGDETKVEVRSDWPNPSFNGFFLPEKREINEKGFSASWKIIDLNRGFQKVLFDDLTVISNSLFGVKFVEPVDHYRKNTRSVKYGVLLISLTFLVFFFIRVLNKINVHPIQYILVGLALCLFFALLLSFSEHIGFNYSYIISSLAVLLLIAFYSKAFLKNWKLTFFNSGIQIFLFIFIFIIIQLDDYALLVGSITLFIILSVIMYLSRNIDWYHLDDSE